MLCADFGAILEVAALNVKRVQHDPGGELSERLLEVRTHLGAQDLCGILCLSQYGTYDLVADGARLGILIFIMAICATHFAVGLSTYVVHREENTTIRRQCLPHVCCPFQATKFTFSKTMWPERCVSRSLIVLQDICALQAGHGYLSRVSTFIPLAPCCALTQPQGVACRRLTGRLLKLHLPNWLVTSGAVQRRKWMALAREMALCGDSWC